METPNAKRRPVLVVSRDEAITVLDNAVVAPVTSTIRNILTCIPVGPDEGVDHESVATFDNLAAVPEAVLTEPGAVERMDPLGRLDRFRCWLSPDSGMRTVVATRGVATPNCTRWLAMSQLSGCTYQRVGNSPIS